MLVADGAPLPALSAAPHAHAGPPPPPHLMMSRPLAQLDAKVVILGSQGVGKTSIVHRYTTHDFDLRATPSTIGAQFFTKKVVIDGVRVRLQLWDTAGQERYKSMMPLYYRGSHAAVIVYDITSRQSFDDVRDWVHELRSNMNNDLVIHVVGAKLDLASQRAVSLEQARDAIRSWFAPPPPPEPAPPRPSTSASSLLFFPTSASTNEAASQAVSGLTRAVSTRLAGMRANSFTNKNTNASATGSLTRSKTAHVAVPGRTMHTGISAGGIGSAGSHVTPYIQTRGASLDILRTMPFPSQTTEEAGGPTSSTSSSSAATATNSLGRQAAGGLSSVSARGGQLLARMRTNSSISLFPSLLSPSTATGEGSGPNSCLKCGAPSAGTPSTSPSSNGSVPVYCTLHAPLSPTMTTEIAVSGTSALDAVLEPLQGPILVVDGIELSEVSAKDDQGVEDVFNSIARKLVEARFGSTPASATPDSASISSQHAKARLGSYPDGDAVLGNNGTHAERSSGHLRARSPAARAGSSASLLASHSNARQSILLHQPDRDDDDDDDFYAGTDALGRALASESGFGPAHLGASASRATSRPGSVHIDHRAGSTQAQQDARWGTCCAV